MIANIYAELSNEQARKRFGPVALLGLRQPGAVNLGRAESNEACNQACIFICNDIYA